MLRGAFRRNHDLLWILLLPTAWLIFAGFSVQVEYYDGYDTICNTLHLSGEADYFLWNRNPTIAAILVPARLIARNLDLQPNDLRPYHLSMALFHFGYLLFILLILRHQTSRRPAAWLAFAAGICCFMFFSYAPFISHDILPGALLLAMLLLSDKFCQKPGWQTWTATLVLGAAAALVKPTYGVFWVAILGSRIIPWLPLRGALKRTPAGRLLWLVVAAVGSAILYWLVMGICLRSVWPDASVLHRPWLQLAKLTGAHQDRWVTPWWLYLRNFGFYGFLTTLLIIPGLWLALRRNRLFQSVSLTWILCFLALNVLSIREVRYIAFLMPVSALLLLPAFEWLLDHRRRLAAASLVLIIDLALAGYEAARLGEPFYMDGLPQQVIADTGFGQGECRRLILAEMLSFMPQRKSPLRGDPFHRIFHLDAYQIRILAPPGHDARRASSPDAIALALAIGTDTALLLPTTRLRRQAIPPKILGWKRFKLFVAPAVAMGPANGTGDRRQLYGEDLRLIRQSTADGSGQTLLAAPGLRSRWHGLICPVLIDPKRRTAYRLQAVGPDQFRILGLPDDLNPGVWNDWIFRAFHPTVLLQPDKDGIGISVQPMPNIAGGTE